MKPLLEDMLGSQLEIAHYHRTYFPHPGFVAEGLILRRKSAPDLAPLGTVKQLAVQGAWTDFLLLRPRVRLVDLQALHIVIPAPGSRANREDFPPGSAADFGGPDSLIQHLKIHDGLLEILRENGTLFSFPIKELDLQNFQKGRTIKYVVDMQNAIPHGHIESSGNFGPLNAGNLAATPVSGTFAFSAVNLHDVGDLRGTLSSAGHFWGALGAIEAAADSDTPEFAVDDGRPTPVHGNVRCTVNGLTGEVAFQQLEVKSGATTIVANGSVAGAPKVTHLEVSIAHGRVQDVLRPFLHGAVPLTGRVDLRAQADLDRVQSGVGFLKRLHVNGTFDVPTGHATDPTMEKTLTDFSHRAQSHNDAPGNEQAADPEADALSTLRGRAQIENGVVSSPDLTFGVPGAQATLQGTFRFRDETAHLTGRLAMQAGISHTATGFKSFLLKPLDPFLRKGSAGAVIPIAVVGGPGHYEVTHDFSHKK
ncbi:MAG TPA: AsmA-like C-terminal region-containing protein [Terracidiphilus sp.]